MFGLDLISALANLGTEEANKARVEAAKKKIDQEVLDWQNDLKNTQVANSVVDAFKLQTLQSSQNMVNGNYGNISNLQASYNQQNSTSGGGAGSLLV